MKIEILNYLNSFAFSISPVDGTCYNIASGNRRIDLRIAACPGYGNTDGYTGWHNVRQLIIMEIVPRTGPHSKFSCAMSSSPL